jgi:hypothetical protein
MKSVKNTCALFLLLGLSAILNSCATGGPVTEVDICVEIPFLDGAEGACVNNVTHKAYLIKSSEWLAMRPTMLMIRASDWNKIRLDWLKGCRLAIRDEAKCNIAVESIDTAYKQLNSIMQQTIKP